jgi:hypothetical protein
MNMRMFLKILEIREKNIMKFWEIQEMKKTRMIAIFCLLRHFIMFFSRISKIFKNILMFITRISTPYLANYSQLPHVSPGLLFKT